MIFSELDRLEFYSGSLHKLTSAEFHVSDWSGGFLAPTNFSELEHLYSYLPRSFSIHDRRLFVQYITDASEYFYPFKDSKKAFLLRHGDVNVNILSSSFVKTRPARSGGNSVILKLNAGRHWNAEIFKQVQKFDVPFKKKKSAAVWRGLISGAWIQDTKMNNTDFQSARSNLISYWGGQSLDWLDIGVTRTVRIVKDDDIYINETTRVSDLVRKPLTIAEQLRFRYILMPEGKDVATGLKWALRSQSLVLMPKPTISSWLMEERLRPWCHYVPVKTDFSDLHDRILFCNENTSLCEEIVRNANHFMTQFEDEEREIKLNQSLIGLYLDRVSFAVAAELQPLKFRADNIRSLPKL